MWAAALEKGRLEGLEIDPAHEAVRWGSIYWGKVTSVSASLDAAFVDLDGSYTGVLYNRDVRVRAKDGSIIKGGERAIGKVFKPGDMIIVQAKSAYLPRTMDSELPLEQKSAQLSMDISIPGRHLIYCPLMEGNHISQRIRKKALRSTLSDMLGALEGMDGFILRSSAADIQTDILVREATILKSVWSELQAFFEGSDPALIMLGPDSIQRILSDLAVEKIERIEVVTMDHYGAVEEWCSVFAPDLVPRVTPIELDDATKDLALFGYRDVLTLIETLFHDYSLLPSGGNLIIQETAALTAIDVNKGADRRSHLAVNVEAAEEVARQVRLRNLGGIIIIDFLKMKTRKEQNELIRALEKGFDEDPCTVQIHGLTSLGLMEITRKRRTPTLYERVEGVEI
ncbi:MAG: ribonuclease E/G [Alphaproteobacteria bacterium]|nr:ribonuclease E/G [Alphaproteobacteria bacterium]MCB9975614.1 ribonuclease E/G [Rhodospirillales bacterium]